ncbi:2Fe-2S iron-sulfur cluster-binding protein [Yoonia sp. SS1-5]|uniref:2Fe-2S iron-sulfur cluster-binding protein n=1 Tax=Yoonia rhodophyticola TaxID=3137370 RepID=A0AAN0NLZ3_9RHOB
MTARRLGTGGLIDRSTPLGFRFDGQPLRGYAGDTLASALLGAGVGIVGRSFKYHRPRGVWGAWTDDPNAIFDVRMGRVTKPNVHGATTPLEDGMILKSVNAFPSARFDLKGALDLLHPVLPAGFYYKTFMWPNWHLFEPAIRKMAGLGQVLPSAGQDQSSLQIHDQCDLLVVGAGPAGLAAARTAAEAGQNVVLVDDHREPGGSLHDDPVAIDGQPATAWITAQADAIKAAGGRIMTRTSAFGVYDHGLISLHQAAEFAGQPTMIKMRVRRMILASGSIDRPVVFENNDRPGVMSIGAAASYLNRYGVLVGERITCIGAPHQTGRHAARFTKAGAEVRQIDPATTDIGAIGRRHLRAVSAGTSRHTADAAVCTAGQTPLIHLWSQAGGHLGWDPGRACFLPTEGPKMIQVIGAARGQDKLAACIEDGVRAARSQPLAPLADVAAVTAGKPRSGRQWIDFQNDVTTKDVTLAARENYASVEHLKRYTTLGMATDQGKTSNINGLTALAAALDRPVDQVGTTRFRPPYAPVPLQLYRGAKHDQQHAPLKRSPLEPACRAAGAAMAEYGGWLRPAWYGPDMDSAVKAECLRARQFAAIMDASTLGKIEVMGPDAADFLNFVYYNTLKTLRIGQLRYGFLLTERGAIYDDGVVGRLGENHFLVSSSSSHADGVTSLLEAWRQDGNDPDQIFVHDVTQQWGTVTVAGPKARDVLAGLDLGISLDRADFPHMTLQIAEFDGQPARIARVSFTGDLSFEISVPRQLAPALWDRLIHAGEPYGAGPVGLEASSVLRAEKGYIIIGKDTDGDTIPPDLGFVAPRDRKTRPYVGDRGLMMDAALSSDRQHLVGLDVIGSDQRLPVGAHIVEPTGTGQRSIGFVTSSYDSPTLGHPIALALLRGGFGRIGDDLTLYHLGRERQAKVINPCVFDPEGTRLHA